MKISRRTSVVAGLILALLTIGVPTASHAENVSFPCSGGGSYTVSKPEGVLTGNLNCKGAVNIDSSVVAIGNSAFSSSYDVTSVVIPSSVTKIGDKAFYLTNLTQVILPQGLTSIGSSAFVFTKISQITFPNSLVSIGSSAFSNTLITSVIIPDSITKIESNVFSSTPLTSVIFGKAVTEIGFFAFYGTKLVNIDIPDSVTIIDSSAFPYIPTLLKILYCGPATTLPTSPTCPPERKAIVDAAKKIAADKAAVDAKIAADKAAVDAKNAADKAAVDAKIAADKAAADAKIRADDKAANDRAIASAQAAKKLSITCVKGKSQKVITGETPSCPTGYTNPIAKYLTFQAFSKCKLYKKNSTLGGVTLADGGRTLTFGYGGKYGYSLASASTWEDIACANKVLGTPSFVLAQISSTRALDGVQRATWSTISSFWTYHPDNGLNISYNCR